MLAVLALCLGVCFLSQSRLMGVVEEMDAKRLEVLEKFESGDTDGAREQFVELAEKWERDMGVLEVLLGHDELHEIKVRIVEARSDFECGDLDDFRRSMAILGEVVSHLYEEERLKLSNIL